jgi:outer membrane usher protein
MPSGAPLSGRGLVLPRRHRRWRSGGCSGLPLISALLCAAIPHPAQAENMITSSMAGGDMLDERLADSAPFASFSQLPDPPTAPPKASTSDGMLFLELVLNGRRTQQIIPVYFENNTIRLRPQDLQRQGVPLHVNGDRLYLSDIPSATFEYQMQDQSIEIHLPDHLLPYHTIGKNRERLDITPADTAFLLNYDAFMSSGLHDIKPQISVFLEQRVTGQFGIFATSGLWRNGSQGGYKRYDSSFRTSHADTATILEFGDFITRNLADASAVRLGGVQISRDFAVRPDIITYPLPRFTGRAALPSTVELLIDGRSVANAEVDPGQFLFDTLPITGGAGQAQLVVTDIHGRSTTTSMPFYISSNLLASGLTDFAVSAGFFRENFGIKNFSYSDFAATASIRHGLRDFLTAELRAEYSRDFWLLGGGTQARLSNLGILSAAIANSQTQGKGGQHMSIGYDYQAGGFSIGLRHIRQSRYYRDLGTMDLFTRAASRRQSLAGINLSMGQWGNVGLNYADFKNEDQPSSRYANLNWSIPAFSRGQFYAQAGRDFTTQGWNASLSLSLSLGGDNGSISAGIADQSKGKRSYRADYSRSVPTDTGIGWNVGASASEDGAKEWRGDFQWRTAPVQFRFGGAGFHQKHGGTTQNIWAGASGGIVLMDGFVALANQLPTNFAVVSTSGFANIPVRYEHQLIGRTNKDGRLFIPTLTPWYPGRVSIDPLELPANVHVPEVERRLVVEGGRGVHVRFAMQKMQPILAAIRDGKGQYIASGSQVTIGGKTVTYIGWDGLLYLEDIAQIPEHVITILTPDQQRCHVQLPTEKLTPDNWNLGELLCASSF